MPPTEGFDELALIRCRQGLGHALRQQGAGLLPCRPHRAAQHRVGRREDVFVAKPAPRQQRARAIEPQRFVLEEPRQLFSGGGVERAQTQVLGLFAGGGEILRLADSGAEDLLAEPDSHRPAGPRARV